MATCPRCHGTTQRSPCECCGARFASACVTTPRAASRRAVSPGGYRIDGPLARGGMGVVFRGTRLSDGTQVVLKAPRSDATHGRERFTREARALATLSHPGVVRLLDMDCTPAGVPLLILEYIPGETLGQRLLRGPLAVSEFERIARGLSEALVHCHQRGVVHRDLKPDNIVLNAERIAVIDFGLALVDADRRQCLRLTPSGIALGTPPYAAPEQLRSLSSAAPASAADSFSLGMVLKDCHHCVAWGGARLARRHWQRVVGDLVSPQPERRPAVSKILAGWPTQKSGYSESFLRRVVTASVIAGACAGALWAGPLLLRPAANSQQMMGWVDEHGRASVVIPLAAGERLTLNGSATTRIRLLGGGAWTSGPLHLTGNASGRVHVRVSTDDPEWVIQLSR